MFHHLPALQAGRQSDLPKGSVKLGASQTGATMYYEPAPAIPLNNAAALLAAKEAQEEAKVLTLLSQLVRAGRARDWAHLAVHTWRR